MRVSAFCGWDVGEMMDRLCWLGVLAWKKGQFLTSLFFSTMAI